MRARQFTSAVLSGHKGPACEVPFDPGVAWGVKDVAIPPRRRGYLVAGKLSGTVPFESAVVLRQGRHWLRLPEPLLRQAKVGIGDRVRVSLRPVEHAEPEASTHPVRPVTREAARLIARVRKIALALPGATEKISHGESAFFAAGKMFATIDNHHHGSAHVSVWCRAEPGAQAAFVEAAPRHFFVPPYLGKSGWLGVRLDTGVLTPVVERLLELAWALAAPAKLRAGR